MMDLDACRIWWFDDLVCLTCPARVLPPGGFDVSDRAVTNLGYDSIRQCRIDADTHTPVCVHPDRIGLLPGRYASAGEPVPAGMGRWLAELLPGPDPSADPQRSAPPRSPHIHQRPRRFPGEESTDDVVRDTGS